MTHRAYVNLTEVENRRAYYVAEAHGGKRYVIQRWHKSLAALISRTDLERLNRMTPPKVAPEEVTLTHFRAELTRLADKAAQGCQYTVTNNDTFDRAALVGLDDLSRLESMDQLEEGKREAAERDETFRRALDEAGLIVSWPSGEPMSMQERLDNLIEVSGQPLSEQVIADRR